MSLLKNDRVEICASLTYLALKTAVGYSPGCLRKSAEESR